MAYVCSLTEASLKKARAELNEDPNEREGAVKALREWIDREPWITAPTDTVHLLAFLRFRKFSQLEARNSLERYWLAREQTSNWSRGKEPDDARILRINKSVPILTPLPGYDQEGRKTILCTYAPRKKRARVIDSDSDSDGEVISLIDPASKDYSFSDFMQAAFTALDTILLDENVQVNGTEFVVDFEGITMQHILKFMGYEGVKHQFELIQRCQPMRLKHMHYINTTPVFETFFAMILPFLGKKLRSRTTVHGKNLVSFLKGRDLSRLPDEYLPDDYNGPRLGSIYKLYDDFIEKEVFNPKTLKVVRQLKMGGFGVDLSKKQSRNSLEQASYRKLNVE